MKMVEFVKRYLKDKKYIYVINKYKLFYDLAHAKGISPELICLQKLRVILYKKRGYPHLRDKYKITIIYL